MSGDKQSIRVTKGINKKRNFSIKKSTTSAKYDNDIIPFTFQTQ